MGVCWQASECKGICRRYIGICRAICGRVYMHISISIYLYIYTHISNSVYTGLDRVI